MKNIFLFIFFASAILYKAQTYPLRTYGDIPENAYVKDTNNELPSYEGTWKGVWDNKTIYITIKNKTNIYDDDLRYYKDYLIGKFKVLDGAGNTLFDNTNFSDDSAKIWGSGIMKVNDKYLLIYNDPDLCNTSGYILINFTDLSKSTLNWKFSVKSKIITDDCQYYNTKPFPSALPQEIILTKQ